jgi:hypothetical protein
MAVECDNRCDCANPRRSQGARAGPTRALGPPVDVTKCQSVVRDSCLCGEQQASQVGRSSYGPLNQLEQTLSFPGSSLNVQMPRHVGLNPTPPDRGSVCKSAHARDDARSLTELCPVAPGARGLVGPILTVIGLAFGVWLSMRDPMLHGWVPYFAVGHSSRCFSYIRKWVERKIRHHLVGASQRHGFGWKRWSRRGCMGCWVSSPSTAWPIDY